MADELTPAPAPAVERGPDKITMEIAEAVIDLLGNHPRLLKLLEELRAAVDKV